MKKSGFTLVELSVTVLIVSCISMVLLMVLRGNLNTMKWGQKHMDFNQRMLLAVRRVFYDIKGINPRVTYNENSGYALYGEKLGEPCEKMVSIRKFSDNGPDEIEFVVDSNDDVNQLFNIKYTVKDKKLIRSVRKSNGETFEEAILENLVDFKLENNETDKKQIYITLSANDPEKGLKAKKIDFAVRLEADFVSVAKYQQQGRDNG